VPAQALQVSPLDACCHRSDVGHRRVPGGVLAGVRDDLEQASAFLAVRRVRLSSFAFLTSRSGSPS
jgi:hypothetical protein